MRNRSADELQSDLKSITNRQNRFGGLHITLSHWHCDIWSLPMTWGFRNNSELQAKVENPPKTTFLNVEAIAVEIGDSGRIGDVFECGFFDALMSKTIDINLEANPYPSLSAVRALLTAAKLDYALSSRLCNYIIEAADTYGVQSFVEAQKLITAKWPYAKRPSKAC
jgi:hypothetical protein